MKIALINPQTENALMRQGYGNHENIGIGLIGAYLELHNYDVSYYDLRIQKLNEKEMCDIVCKNKYAIVAFSVNYATDIRIPFDAFIRADSFDFNYM